MGIELKYTGIFPATVIVCDFCHGEVQDAKAEIVWTFFRDEVGVRCTYINVVVTNSWRSARSLTRTML